MDKMNEALDAVERLKDLGFSIEWIENLIGNSLSQRDQTKLDD